MLAKSFKFLFFSFLILSFLSFGQLVFANGNCYSGDTQDCGTCGSQACERLAGEEIVWVWGECEAKKETEDCGDCGVKVCECDVGGDCDWGNCDEATKPNTRTTTDWDEYRCQGREEEVKNCGQEYIEKRECSKYKTRTCACDENRSWDCPEWNTIAWSETSCDDEELEEECDLDWQLCSGSTSWTTSSRSCDCAGTCLEIPENPRYYNNPNYPTDPYEPEESEDSNNIFLPVKLDWDNVKAWKNGWREQEEEGGWVLKECSEDCFQSYLIKIDNTASGNFSKNLTEDSEYSSTQDQGSCFLKSGVTHDWKVSPCCGEDESNCKPWGDITLWSFTTNSAPEPILPADPDWEGEQIKLGAEIPALLDWCDANDAQSFRVRIYYIDNEAEVCHPSLTFGGQCDSKIIRTENRPPPYYDPAKDILYSDFLDNEGFFTKDTEYRWEMATCFYENGTNCSEFGQKWRFDTTLVTLPILQLESPPNDPSGEQAVGFPVILEWKDEPGMNSFVYDVYKESPGELTDNTNLSQKVFDYPALSLNTFYTWMVKPCWDYEGLDCEDWLVGQERVFKTTGAPPNLISPENNASNVPIPIKLEWGEMSGAKSYRYWVYSGYEQLEEQLIADGVTSEDFLLIKYDPDSKQPEQETNYYWQVATCADESGETCGSSTNLRKLTTFKLSAPSNLLPEGGKTIFTYQIPKVFSWDSNAKYFRFISEYTEKAEEDDRCSLGIEGKNIDNNFYSLSLSCLGEYRWQVQACLDENCDQKGELTPFRYFTLNQTTPPTQFGLVPCGRSSNNLDTPWNERDPCQFKHLFILLRNILDFLLWRVTLIILLLLVVATAVIFYFSIGAPALVIDIRAVWRAAGKGYAIIFLSWMIINLVLNILGYQVGIFGQWWQINF